MGSGASTLTPPSSPEPESPVSVKKHTRSSHRKFKQVIPILHWWLFWFLVHILSGHVYVLGITSLPSYYFAVGFWNFSDICDIFVFHLMTKYKFNYCHYSALSLYVNCLFLIFLISCYTSYEVCTFHRV
jgi:hypothetical protein